MLLEMASVDALPGLAGVDGAADASWRGYAARLSHGCKCHRAPTLPGRYEGYNFGEAHGPTGHVKEGSAPVFIQLHGSLVSNRRDIRG
jgi:hypothetical protein